MGAVRGLAEIVLMVGDLERSVHFYRDILGLTVISPPGPGPVFLQAGEPSGGVPQQIVLAPRPAAAPAFPAQRPFRSLHHIGLEVDPDDLDAEQARLRDLGFEVRTGQHPFLPVEAIYVDDPDGNEVELVCSRG
jgi:catechol 2,3-dioxygenase